MPVAAVYSAGRVVPVTGYSARESASHRWGQPLWQCAAYIVPVASIVPVSLAAAYRYYICIGADATVTELRTRVHW